MMSKVAVVVASSNTGAACVKALRNQDAVRVSVRAAFRSADKAELYKAEAGLSANVEVISGVDAYDTASLGNAFAGCETAVVVTPHDMSRGFDDDAMLTLNMINAAVASGVKHLIYVGSWTVTEPDGVGMIAKRFIPAEKKLEELISSNPDFTFSSLRSGFFNLNLVNMFGSLRKGNELRFPKECSFPPVDPRDVGKAAAALALVPPEQRKSGYYHISGPEMFTAADMASVFAEGLRRPITLADAVSVDQFSAPLPPPLKELVAFMGERKETAIPLSDDFEQITGKKPMSLRDWVEEHKGLFELEMVE